MLEMVYAWCVITAPFTLTWLLFRREGGGWFVFKLYLLALAGGWFGAALGWL